MGDSCGKLTEGANQEAQICAIIVGKENDVNEQSESRREFDFASGIEPKLED